MIERRQNGGKGVCRAIKGQGEMGGRGLERSDRVGGRAITLGSTEGLKVHKDSRPGGVGGSQHLNGMKVGRGAQGQLAREKEETREDWTEDIDTKYLHNHFLY
jgi:hypothetical protein